jgi:hypothetical protein
MRSAHFLPNKIYPLCIFTLKKEIFSWAKNAQSAFFAQLKISFLAPQAR